MQRELIAANAIEGEGARTGLRSISIEYLEPNTFEGMQDWRNEGYVLLELVEGRGATAVKSAVYLEDFELDHLIAASKRAKEALQTERTFPITSIK